MQFEFVSKNQSNPIGGIVKKKRILIGRSNACDIIFNFPEITSIHAVIEVVNGRCKIYDMNSKNGTFVRGERVIVSDINPGELITLGNHEFLFRKIIKDQLPPPPLDMLRPIFNGEESSKRERIVKKDHLPPSLKESFVSRVEYPLAEDPKAKYSKYIFEDVEILFPIFHYESGKKTVEVIISYRDKIFSIDYLNNDQGIYNLCGRKKHASDIEFPYLMIDEKIPLVEVTPSEVFIHVMGGYSVISLVDKEKEINGKMAFILGMDDIVCFQKGDVKIFVRGAETPPRVDRAPIFRRDRDLKKYLILVLLFIFMFLAATSYLDIDKEIEKEKAPERIATILYKPKKLVISKNDAIDKTKDAEMVVQKSPSQNREEVKQVQDTKNIESKEIKKSPVAATGVKEQKSTKIVQKTDPNKGPNNLKSSKVSPSKSSSKSSELAGKGRPDLEKINKGSVDTYKSLNFSSTLNSLMAKGGGLRSVKVEGTALGDGGVTGMTGESATLEKAEVSKNIGSLTGAAKGKLEAAEGLEGIVSKKSIYTAGLPFKTVILGGIDPDVIRRILIDHIPQFRFCYQKELDRQVTSYKGIVRLNFIIGASGHVSNASVETASNDIPEEVKGCVARILKGIKFPRPLGGAVAEIRQPLNFYPKGN